jgi:predicted small lipoprotein YifL
MKKITSSLLALALVLGLAACGQGNVPADNKAEVNQGEKAPKESPAFAGTNYDIVGGRPTLPADSHRRFEPVITVKPFDLPAWLTVRQLFS